MGVPFHCFPSQSNLAINHVLWTTKQHCSIQQNNSSYTSEMQPRLQICHSVQEQKITSLPWQPNDGASGQNSAATRHTGMAAGDEDLYPLRVSQTLQRAS